ncbi:putative mucin TcMUCII [Trypanosoma cruzi]|uniref:Mucin TcMUCII, putative n=2 Tax=Trypanosoma cruzi TaxID=5693 RepID=Q4DED0_TRYCC|nr:mucin TcMUCII, putative [Trypanosoma cruzi]EAN90880.1 mucin TcMUCII, putative [Trypanosoma cruzi]PWV12295.1 putative mucin TcMUCII [Trypanosoma cruzi]RNC40229.1 mucin TcMUCII [Trypanosoma cruzi]|eukprot:XP_812731.1 mucin TcMUCII [Trypanosoma cruzi strain CL Brener]
MTTCHLLCALLVLALCCCPSVCAADVNRKAGSSSPTTTTTNKIEPPKEDKEDTSETQKNAKNPSPPVLVGAPGKDQSGLPNKESVGKPVTNAESGNVDGEGQSLAVTGQKLNNMSSTSQAEDNKGTIGLQGDKNISADTQTKSEAPAETTTTTTTTQAPTTTTTSAPVAPSTANTEAPTTTTTRAPSRLREVDGSLSSSAWVCAPLLLALSALVYTAVN